MKKRIAAVLAVASLAVAGLALGASPASAEEGGGPDGHHCLPFGPVNTILGSFQNDVLNGSECDDLIVGFRGNDVLRGRGGEDELRGNLGNDRLNGVEVFGEPREDVLYGGRGFDTCVIDFLDQAVGCEVVIEVDPF